MGQPTATDRGTWERYQLAVGRDEDEPAEDLARAVVEASRQLHDKRVEWRRTIAERRADRVS